VRLNLNQLELSLRKLVEAVGVSGCEKAVRETILRMLPSDTESRVDAIGNLIASIGSGEPHIILIAHMDELGFTVSNIESNGFVKLRKVGSFDDRYLPGKVFQIHTKEGPVEGVIGLTPPHLIVDREEFNRVLHSDELFLDLGTRSMGETSQLGVKLSDPVTIKKDFSIINHDYFCCRSIDDRFGCLALVETLKRLRETDLMRKIMFVWSVREETGLEGSKVIANTVRADKAIVVDSYPSADAPLISFHLAPAKLGDGPVIRIVDNGATATPELVERARNIAQKHAIPLGSGPTGGMTDGRSLLEKGILMVPIAIPIRYMHSPVEMCHRQDLEKLIELLAHLAVEI
jgi:putative aminopeptidase FrvX